MRALLIACSKTAWERIHKLKELWQEEEPETELICKGKCAALGPLSEKQSLAECVGEWFGQVDAIVFVCAAGIAVRSIAPWLVHKGTDPAVIVMDEKLEYCIPLLSGHWGGANELAGKLARMTGALAVITTATDREEKFAVDVFARKNGLWMRDWKLAKKISARILEGEQILLYCECPIEGEAPGQLVPAEDKEKGQLGIAVSCRRSAQQLFGETLQLIPRRIVAGIGCKKGTPEEKIEAAVEQCLLEADICPEALCKAASIDLKKEEAGLTSWCRKKGLPFETFSSRELWQVPGDFSESAFVESVTGVSNVCERSAAAAAQGTADSLICTKKIYDGVTVALAEKKGSVRF